MADSYYDVTNEDFADKVLQAPQLVVVFFAAEKSNSCQIQEPEFVAISKEYQDRASFAKVNVEKEENLTRQWNIDGIPTLVFFKGAMSSTASKVL
ncbi:thioredoxin family protein [Ktedonospora formicarum]|uniref:Thioredoxin domain-containing protein n=1 Tax=Ktedonospora formicarum TaxID=2778364 RepID=A0A8J3I2B3_9CHLR|nr:thioredoxin domain-containing protein [Ktedonospora formicarum]GHO45428.1 hypothetical protein KSX_35910 [Ktedonospora formicarum]